MLWSLIIIILLLLVVLLVVVYSVGGVYDATISWGSERTIDDISSSMIDGILGIDRWWIRFVRYVVEYLLDDDESSGMYWPTARLQSFTFMIFDSNLCDNTSYQHGDASGSGATAVDYHSLQFFSSSLCLVFAVVVVQ